MRIAFDAVLLGRNNTGVENYIECLLDALNRTAVFGKDRIDAYCQGQFCSPPQWESISIRHAPACCRYRPLRILWEQTLLPRRLWHTYDLLHTPAYVAPLMSDVPTVLTVHDLIALDHPELCRVSNALYYRTLMPTCIRRASQLIVPTRWVRSRLRQRYPEAGDKATVIYEGVRDLFRQKPERLAQERVGEKFGIRGRMLLFVGNLEPKKNLLILLAAFSRLKTQFRDLSLVLCGRMGWKTRPLRRILSQFRFHDDVVLPGYVSVNTLHALYSTAQVFVFPSIVEGFGVPPLEAMACGTPVITSDAGAISEVVDDCALKVNAGDSTALRNAIASVLNSPGLREELQGRGLLRSQLFTWERAAQETLQVYDRVCQQA